MVCRVNTCFIGYWIEWADYSGIEHHPSDTRHITLEKLLEEIGDKKEISLIIDDELPALIPDKLSQCVKRLLLYMVSRTDKHSISTW